MIGRRCWPLLTVLVLLVSCESPAPGDTAAEPAGASPATAADGIRTRVEVQSDRPVVGPATVVVYVLDGNEGVEGATVEVTGDMTHAGMAPVIADAAQAEPGLYRTEDFRFTMAGDWILTAEIKLPSGTTSRATTTVQVTSP